MYENLIHGSSTYRLISLQQKLTMLDDQVDKLAQINQKLGAFPVVELADGQVVPTGTVATLLYNIRAYDELVAKSAIDQAVIVKLKQLEREITAAVPVLKKLGMFELFSIEEWCLGDHPGRQLVGQTAKELMATTWLESRAV